MVHQNRGKHKNEASLEELIRENSMKKRGLVLTCRMARGTRLAEIEVILGKKSGENLKTLLGFQGCWVAGALDQGLSLRLFELSCCSLVIRTEWRKERHEGVVPRLLSDSAWGGLCETCSTLELNAVYCHVLSLLSLTLLMSPIGWSTYNRL